MLGIGSGPKMLAIVLSGMIRSNYPWSLSLFLLLPAMSTSGAVGCCINFLPLAFDCFGPLISLVTCGYYTKLPRVEGPRTLVLYDCVSLN